VGDQSALCGHGGIADPVQRPCAPRTDLAHQARHRPRRRHGAGIRPSAALRMVCAAGSGRGLGPGMGAGHPVPDALWPGKRPPQHSGPPSYGIPDPEKSHPARYGLLRKSRLLRPAGGGPEGGVSGGQYHLALSRYAGIGDRSQRRVRVAAEIAPDCRCRPLADLVAAGFVGGLFCQSFLRPEHCPGCGQAHGSVPRRTPECALEHKGNPQLWARRALSGPFSPVVAPAPQRRAAGAGVSTVGQHTPFVPVDCGHRWHLGLCSCPGRPVPHHPRRCRSGTASGRADQRSPGGTFPRGRRTL